MTLSKSNKKWGEEVPKRNFMKGYLNYEFDKKFLLEKVK